MPSKVSDIHEISVLVGISGKCSISDLIEKKFSTFEKYKISQYPEEDWADFISSKVIKKDGPNFGCFLENQTGII